MARPKKLIDESLVEKLAAIHCTMEEISSVCECSVDTLERRFADIIKKAKDKGKTSLRRHQWEVAQKGNVSMLIWLGKQLLGQKDQILAPAFEAKVDGKASIVLKWTDGDNPGDAEANAASD